MARLIFLIAVAVLLVTGLRWLRQLTPAARSRFAGNIAAAALTVLLLLGVVTGRLPWLGALLAALIPLSRQLLPLLLRALPGPSGRRASPRGAGGQSRASTATLSMTLDHASGLIGGHVVAGPFAGRELESLDDTELLQLLRHCRQHDPDAADLLVTYLNQRLGPDWEATQRDEHDAASGRSGASPMSEQEALAVLGLQPGASRADILAAHRRLMQKLHPDRGGNDYLAAQVNRARDRLLS